MLERWVEDDKLLTVLEKEGIGCIAFSPLAQGLLTDKYIDGIPEGSRASKLHGFLKPADINDDTLSKVKRLNDLARGRGQTLAQIALAWVLRHKAMTSVLISTSKVEQIEDAVATRVSNRSSIPLAQPPHPQCPDRYARPAPVKCA
ncbi:MAG: aldo/keto reductase [Anaerolineales bacterium]|nr:aldo/keto reductase [Anaerolineales bacterium]